MSKRTTDTGTMDNAAILQETKRMAGDVDQKLARLEEGTRRVHEVAVVIRDETKRQEDFIDRLDHHTVSTNGSVEGAVRATRERTEKASQKGLLATVVCLFVVLGVVLVIAVCV